jgi:hypothetical protein
MPRFGASIMLQKYNWKLLLLKKSLKLRFHFCKRQKTKRKKKIAQRIDYQINKTVHWSLKINFLYALFLFF